MSDKPALNDMPADRQVDWQLVQRTLAGDQKAFELLVLKYQKRIERLVARMVRDVDAVPDITQETFIRAYRALHQFHCRRSQIHQRQNRRHAKGNRNRNPDQE